MFVRSVLSVLCTFFIILSNADEQVDNSTIEYDDFIPFLNPQPIKDPFDWKLLQKFTSARGYKNVLLSPFSLKLCLALLYEGSGGVTQKEFQKVLNFSEDASRVRQEFQDIFRILDEKSKKYIIDIGTRLFLDSRFPAETTFASKAKEFYHTDIVNTNFSNPSNASANINSWIDSSTRGHIKSMVHPEDVENAVLLLVNAIYFQGSWISPFPENETYSGDFHSSDRGLVPVRYMTVTEQFFYHKSNTLNAEILRLPYKDRKFALYIILPHARDGLPYLLDNLNITELTMAVFHLEKKPIKVILPKFKFDFQVEFARVLQEFGFDTIFRSISSFPGIVRDNEAQLVVTNILQKSGIEVNEEGSVVYTTTQVIISNKFGEPVGTFNASRPFLFYIQEEGSKNILFIGKVENPSKIEPEQVKQPENDLIIHEIFQTVPFSEPASPPIIPPQSASLGSQFDLDLLKYSIGKSTNVFLSPATVKVSLAMLAEASSGRTSEQIYNVLRIPYNQRNRLIQGLISELSETQPHSVLSFHNALFVSDKQRIKQQYKSTVERYYRALVRQVNYQDTEGAANIINNFVNKATRGHIPSVLQPYDINPDAKILLTNALYFKAQWRKTFEQNVTKSSCFYGPRGCITVQFMSIIENFGYLETPNAHIVKMDYAGNLRAMLLVVPKEQNGLLAALKDLEVYQGFGELTSLLNETEVELYLPSFQIDFGVNIKHTLHEMGIRDVFGINSNLSNLFENGSSGLVDSFFHKAKIEVTEEGTEASSVSIVSVIPLMGSSNPKIKVDHPFAFFIYNTHTNTILFEGILNEPEQKSGVEVKTRSRFTYPQAIENDPLLTQQVQNQDQQYLMHNLRF